MTPLRRFLLGTTAIRLVETLRARVAHLLPPDKPSFEVRTFQPPMMMPMTINGREHAVDENGKVWLDGHHVGNLLLRPGGFRLRYSGLVA
jgi:hypothetical protein